MRRIGGLLQGAGQCLCQNRRNPSRGLWCRWLFRRVQLGHVRGIWLRACPQVFCSHRMDNVRGDAVVSLCASVHAARLLPLLLAFGGAGLRTRGRGSAYPFFALIGSSTSKSTSEEIFARNRLRNLA